MISVERVQKHYEGLCSKHGGIGSNTTRAYAIARALKHAAECPQLVYVFDRIARARWQVSEVTAETEREVGSRSSMTLAWSLARADQRYRTQHGLAS